MTQGRGIARPAALLLLILALQCCGLWHSASAATYTVGGSKGWDIGIDYTSWVAGKTFKVGDILYFPYLQEQHNVVVVGKADYDACSGGNPVATFSDGNTNVTLSTTGKHYYLCSVIGHCAAGMKLSVTVAAAAAAAPPTAPPPAIAPAPSSPPSAAPPSTSTPSPAPSSPSPSPSPSPSSPAPAPAPVPTPSPSPSAPVPAAGPPASSPGAPGAPGSSAGTPPSSPPAPPNAAPSLLASGAILPLVALCAALFVSHY